MALPLGLIFILVATGNCNDYYDYPDYVTEEDPVNLSPPYFQTRAQNFSVPVGSDITFPCEGENLDSYTMIFKTYKLSGDEHLLYVGPSEVRHNERLTKEGNSFVLRNIRRKDAGQYVCKMESDPVVQIRHNLNVEFAPKVRLLSPGIQNVTQGSSVTLRCEAEGNPKPRITWTRKDGHLPSGAKTEEGYSITFQEVDRHVEGTYVCTAFNKIGESKASTVIEVQYPPEIITEQSILHTGEGDEAKLVCLVHGRPNPKVTWLKDNTLLWDEDNVRTHDGAHKHTLTIRNVNEEDLGNYTCRATNSNGEASGTLTLTGRPKAPRLTSSPNGGEKESYTITWETESFSPITQYRIKYRKAKGFNSSRNSHGGWQDSLYSPSDKQWNITPKGSGIHRMFHPIHNLDAATDYESVVMVENKFGWSANSDVFRFHTRKEVAIGHSSKGSPASFGPFGTIVALLLFSGSLIFLL